MHERIFKLIQDILYVENFTQLTSNLAKANNLYIGVVDLLTTNQIFLIKTLIFLSFIMLFGWSKSRFSLRIWWDERLWDTEAVSLSSDENIYERSDSFSFCHPSDDIFSECLRGTKHMLFKQVPWTMVLPLNSVRLMSENRNVKRQQAKQVSKEIKYAQQQLSCESS